jgi:hypothetical protein
MMKIMKLLTHSIIKPVIESDGVSQCHISPRSSASHPAAPFARIPADGGNAAAQRQSPEGWSGFAKLGFAILFVVAAGTAWGWAIMHLGGLLVQAEALVLRNTYPLS